VAWSSHVTRPDRKNELRRPNIDTITLEVQWQRLITIVDEMDTATIRTSFSTIVGESHDFGCVMMDQDCQEISKRDAAARRYPDNE